MLTITVRSFVHFTKSATVPIPAKIFYRVVAQTDRYQHFIPWCTSSKILQTLSKNENRTELMISFNSFDQKFVSHVKLSESAHKYSIHSLCKDSPLTFLDSKWKIEQLSPKPKKGERSIAENPQTTVKYNLEFDFNSFAYRMASGIFLDFLGTQMWDIFLKQARKIHQSELLYGNLETFLEENTQIRDKYNQQLKFKGQIDRIWKQHSSSIDGSTQEKLSKDISALVRQEN